MAKKQRGSVAKRSDRNFGVRYYDEHGERRYQGGFTTRTAAEEWMDAKVDEVAALRRGDAAVLARREPVTVAQAINRYLAQHDVDPATTAKLRRQLRRAEQAFGDRQLHTLQPYELGAWRRTLPSGSRHDFFRALRQVLEQAAAWHWIDVNPARPVKNPKPKPPQIQPFESWDELDVIAAELDARYAAIPGFAAGSGLRPQEWIALERRDLDRVEGVVTIERVYTQ